MSNSAVFVPHFHWDREWYEPFQVFRHRLVTALDTVLETAEANPDFRFTVDGQMAAIEDYLEMRPENRDRLVALVTEGRLAIGPWLILLDEFLCSGETIVRNLQMGWAAAERLGGAMPVGYLPDMFGHVAQMPQILARAGIEHAALWRGVPGSVDGHAFRWRAPDGSEVRTEFLFDGYDNGLDVLLVPDQIGRALGEYAEMTAERWGGDPVLAMAGTDHNAPDPHLAAWLRQASGEGRAITIATLDEYLRKHVRDEVSATVTGELRSHVRGNILPGVLSVRLGLKQRMALAERTVDHAERMNALWSRRDDSPFLSLAWHKIIESTAHDSVVGSGTDETCDQVAARLAEAAQTARAVRDAALAEPAALVPSDGHLVANPLPFGRTALVEVDVAAPPAGTGLTAIATDGSAHPVQLIAEAPTVLSDERMDASQLERVLRRIHRRELFGRLIDRYELTPGQLVFHLAEVPTSGPFDLLILRREVAAAAAAHPGEWRVLTVEEARATALVPVQVPASGLTTFRVEPREDTAPAPTSYEPATATDRTLSNGLVEVTVAADGTLDITGSDGTVLNGVGRLVDGGDRGDSYNYAPPAQDILVADPTEITVDLSRRARCGHGCESPASTRGPPRSPPTAICATNGSCRRRWRRSWKYVPVNRSYGCRPRSSTSPPTTGCASTCRCPSRWPRPRPPGSSPSPSAVSPPRAAGASTRCRPSRPVRSCRQAPPLSCSTTPASTNSWATAPNSPSPCCARSARSASTSIPLRDEPAASEIPAPGAQDLGMRIENRFAVVPSATGWRGANAVALAEEFRNDVLVTRGTAPAGGQLPPDTAGLRVEGQDVLVSGVRRVTDDESGAGTEVRLAAMNDSASTVRVTGTFSEVTTVDLLGRPISRTQAPDELELALGPWEIRTVVLR
jgi:mannosylglycerate hydrolase